MSSSSPTAFTSGRLDTLALQVQLGLGGHDGLNIIRFGQGVHVHVIVDHQQAAFQIGTGKAIVLHFLDTAVAGGIPHEPFQYQPDSGFTLEMCIRDSRETRHFTFLKENHPMKKNISRNPLWPDWYNGKKIDEVQFGRAFLEQWPLKCVNGTLYTLDGPVEDESEIKQRILEAKGDLRLYRSQKGRRGYCAVP